jgi:hypothetical protein
VTGEELVGARLEERVQPHVLYRQWTLSFPHRVRWVLLKDAGLLSDVLTFVLRSVFALQRRRARRQGPRGAQAGAVSFIQFFGSALQVTPHFHSQAHSLQQRLRWTEVDVRPPMPPATRRRKSRTWWFRTVQATEPLRIPFLPPGLSNGRIQG